MNLDPPLPLAGPRSGLKARLRRTMLPLPTTSRAFVGIFPSFPQEVSLGGENLPAR